MKQVTAFIGFAPAAWMAMTSVALAVDPTIAGSHENRSRASEATQVTVSALDRAPILVSALPKTIVRNTVGEFLGTIDDLVIVESGEISYAVLGFGGVLGVGKKLFAVPLNQLQLRNDHGKQYLVLDVSLEALKKAPGFDPAHWPDSATPNFTEDIERRYGRGSRSR